MRRYPLIALLALATALAAGAASPSIAFATTIPVGTRHRAGPQDSLRITQEEITAANLPTSYDLVERLRRQWLRRDKLTGEEVVVYLDQQNIGGADKLHDIPAVEVSELQFLPHADAVKRWGADIKGSVILVTRRR